MGYRARTMLTSIVARACQKQRLRRHYCLPSSQAAFACLPAVRLCRSPYCNACSLSDNMCLTVTTLDCLLMQCLLVAAKFDFWVNQNHGMSPSSPYRSTYPRWHLGSRTCTPHTFAVAKKTAGRIDACGLTCGNGARDRKNGDRDRERTCSTYKGHITSMSCMNDSQGDSYNDSTSCMTILLKV